MQSIAQDGYQAAFLMLIGMGFVFLFLTLLVIWYSCDPTLIIFFIFIFHLLFYYFPIIFECV
ncbi:MAG: hypothetical protein Q9M92_10045, partial [Enterobacterales bacterium]|nr:hypothetical protein [Enterobacterales bacterium]